MCSETLVTDNIAFAKWLARKYTPKHLLQHLDDIIQAILVQMVRAVKYYDPTCGKPFVGYVKRWATKVAIVEVLRASRRGVYVPRRLEYGTANEERVVVPTVCSPNEIPHDSRVDKYTYTDMNADDMWEDVKHILSERQYTMLRMKYVEYMLERDIGKQFGVTRQAVHHTIRTAIDRLRKHYRR